MKGEWEPGVFNLGRWSSTVTYSAAAWIILQTINIVWPRTIADQPWFLNWSMIIIVCVLAVVGLIVYRVVRPNIKAPIGERMHTSDDSAPSAG